MDYEESIKRYNHLYNELPGLIKEAKKKVSLTIEPTIKTMQGVATMIMKYVKDKGLLMRGGTAINDILPEDKKIYGKDELPDIDVYSPDFYKDTIELANILYKNKVPYVQVLRAKHNGTARIRTHLAEDAIIDISWIPQATYDALKKEALVIRGIYYCNPQYLKIDLYMMLAHTLYTEAFRWEKAWKRIGLLEDVFPLGVSKIPTAPKAVDKYASSLMKILMKNEENILLFDDNAIEAVITGKEYNVQVYPIRLYTRTQSVLIKECMKALPKSTKKEYAPFLWYLTGKTTVSMGHTVYVEIYPVGQDMRLYEYVRSGGAAGGRLQRDTSGGVRLASYHLLLYFLYVERTMLLGHTRKETDIVDVKILRLREARRIAIDTGKKTGIEEDFSMRVFTQNFFGPSFARTAREAGPSLQRTEDTEKYVEERLPDIVGYIPENKYKEVYEVSYVIPPIKMSGEVREYHERSPKAVL